MLGPGDSSVRRMEMDGSGKNGWQECQEREIHECQEWVAGAMGEWQECQGCQEGSDRSVSNIAVGVSSERQ